MRRGGVPFSFKQVLIDCAKLSARVDEIARSQSSIAMVLAKSSFGSIVVSSFGSSFFIWSGRRDKASAIMSLAPGTWVKILLKRGKSFVQQVCRSVRHRGSRC